MTNSTTTLRSLQTAVNELHANVGLHLQSAKEIAAEAGAKLIEAKSILKHGEFKPWIEENCSFSYRTAKNYMDVAQAKMQSVALFNAAKSINEVLNIGKEKNLTQLERIALIQKFVHTDWCGADERTDELSECFQALNCSADTKDDQFIQWFTCGLTIKTRMEENGSEGLMEWVQANSPLGRTAKTPELAGAIYYAENPNKFEVLREVFPQASMEQLGLMVMDVEAA